MKLFFTLFLVIAGISYANAQVDPYAVKATPAISLNPPGSVVAGKAKIRFICRAFTSTLYKEPLVVIDGTLCELNDLQKLNPGNIASIDVLKDNFATAIYGYNATEGVVIITTKIVSFRKFMIKDFLTGAHIPNATICFISEKDSVKAMASDSGILITDKLRRGIKYDITVSSVGYKTFSTTVNSGSQEILLERDMKECDSVMISAIENRRRISCGSVCTVIRETKLETMGKNFSRSIYPNPVQRNNAFNLELENKQNETMQLAIISSNGNIVSLQTKKMNKGIDRFSVNADAKWAAGVYIIQLRNEQGLVITQEKLVVQ